MIITRTPFRVSFLGGGTDIPWFYENHGGGAVISSSINRYMYLAGHPMFNSSEILLKYSQTELVASASELRHPIARAILMHADMQGVDISVSADIPAGTGLGSSSAFTVGLSLLTSAMKGLQISNEELAAEACRVELDVLREPIGKQDQYASAFGGLNLFQFDGDGVVRTTPLNLEESARDWLNESLLLVRVGSLTRSASSILLEQSNQAKSEYEIVRSLQELRDLTLDSFEAIKKDVRNLGGLLNASWELKKLSSPRASSDDIQSVISQGLALGALGGKLLGAGQGGFVLFLAESEVCTKLETHFGRLSTVRVKMDHLGAKVVYND